MREALINVCLMQSFRRISLLIFVLGFLAAACSSCGDKEPGPEPDNNDTNGDASGDEASFMDLDYHLESAEGFEPAEGSTIRLGFREGEMSALGFNMHGGCNSLLGDFTLADGVMSVSQIMMTEMACATELMEQDTWLVTFMSASPAYVYNDRRLTLTGSDATLVFLDRELADPDRPLVGPLWTIDNYLDGMANTAVNLVNRPTVQFGEDGQVSVDTGCNTGGGTYTVEGNTIAFSPMNFTRMACVDEDASWAESHVQSVLDGATVTYEIDANHLSLNGESKGLGASTDQAIRESSPGT